MIENINIYGFEEAIRGMRNSWDSWDKSDNLGENDLQLMKKLCKAGSDHRKFLRMITVSCDITAPIYWWKEFDTYKVGTVRNSCSTIHTITNKEFTIDDFTHGHLLGAGEKCLQQTIDILNELRECYLETKFKVYWYQIIQLLPSSYNQRATVLLNYEVLMNMYHSRKNHKLDEWREFCELIEDLPYSEIITEV